MSIFTLSISTGVNFQGVVTEYVSPIRLSLATGIKLVGVPSVVDNRTILVSVAANVGFQGVASLFAHRLIPISIGANIGFSGSPVLAKLATYTVNVTANLGLQGVVSLAKQSTYTLAVSAGLGLQPVVVGLSTKGTHTLTVTANLALQAVLNPNITKNLSIAVGLGLQGVVTATGQYTRSVSSGLGLQGVVSAWTRVLTLTVTCGLGLAGATVPASAIDILAVAGNVGFQGVITASIDTHHVAAGLGLQTLVTCEVVCAQDLPTGPPIKLLSGLSGSFPLTFAETPAGVVLMANGVDPMLRWDGLSQAADYAGVTPPSTPVTLTPSGLGTITGVRNAFCRFIDSAGNPSNLSPIGSGVSCGRDQSIDDIASSGSAVIIQSRGHGLLSGSSVIIQGVNGLPINGQWQIFVTDQDHFVLVGLNTPFATNMASEWTGGGSWVQGSSSLTYGSLALPAQSRVTQLQLLRNLEGNLDVLYVEAVLPFSATATLPTTYVSSLTDDQLCQNEAVVVRTQDNPLYGLRYATPPSNRPYLLNHSGRIFAAGDAVIFAGCVSVTAGSNSIQGIGTQWTTNLVGRQIYIRGSSQPYGILSINSTAQICLLSETYTGASNPFATYLIRLSPQERKILQWSEADNPEAWPPWNALSLPEDNDEITGLFARGTYLYVAERRHIWRFQFTDDPGTSGHAFLMLDQRGAINQRCVVHADDHTYIMDETGIYEYDGASGFEAISDPIQNIFYQDGLTFTQQVDWSADQTLWHASLDPIRTIIRWFVTMVGQPPLSWAICFNYRQKRWWLEQYPVAISSSCTGTLAEAPNVGIPSGYRRPLVGADARQVLVLGEGALDLVSDDGTVSGTATAGTATTITDTSASFAANLGGVPVSIVSGTGAGQTSLVSSSTGNTLTVVDPFDIPPDSTSVYQLGGISYAWRSGWLDVEDAEQNTNRDLILSFEPLTDPVTLAVDLYYDHSATPQTWSYNQSLDGVNVYAGQPGIYFDLTSSDVLPGYRVYRQAQHTERYAYSDRFVAIALSGVANAEVVRVYQVSLRGVDQEGL